MRRRPPVELRGVRLPGAPLLFDLNDFDETLPGPWEWDVKRLAASFVVAGRDNGFDAADCRGAAQACVASYRQRMTRFSEMGELEVWYTRIGEEEVKGLLTEARAGKDHEKTEQERAEGARPRQPAGPLQADQGRRWTQDHKRRPAAPGPHPRRG